MYDVQLCTYVVHARYIPVTSDLRMRNRHGEYRSDSRYIHKSFMQGVFFLLSFR